jgi:WD40 repeat protein
MLRFWDSATGNESSTAKREIDVGAFGQMKLSSDGATLIGLVDDTKLRLWSTATGQALLTLDALATDPGITRAAAHLTALSRDGKTLVWRLGPTITIWDVASKKLMFKDYRAHPWSFAVALSPDGKLLACHRGGPPHIIELWDWKSNKKLVELPGFQGHVYALAVSPDGKTVAAGDELATIRLWDVATHKEIATFKGHGGGITALIFAPDGQWLYSAASDGLVRRWKPAPQPDPDKIADDISCFPVKVGFSPDCKSLFMASVPKTGERRLELKHWDLERRRELVRFQGGGSPFGVSSDGHFVLLGKSDDQKLHGVQLWDVRANKMLAVLEGQGWAYGNTFFPRIVGWLPCASQTTSSSGTHKPQACQGH